MQRDRKVNEVLSCVTGTLGGVLKTALTEEGDWVLFTWREVPIAGEHTYKRPGPAQGQPAHLPQKGSERGCQELLQAWPRAAPIRGDGFKTMDRKLFQTFVLNVRYYSVIKAYSLPTLRTVFYYKYYHPLWKVSSRYQPELGNSEYCRLLAGGSWGHLHHGMSYKPAPVPTGQRCKTKVPSWRAGGERCPKHSVMRRRNQN